MAQVSAETALPTDGEAGFPLTGRHHWPADGPLYRGGGEEAEAPRQLIARVADVVQHDCHTASHVPPPAVPAPSSYCPAFTAEPVFRTDTRWSLPD